MSAPRVEQIGDATLYLADCMDVLPTLEGVDAVVTDPPYHLTSIVKRFGKPGSAPAQYGKDGAFARASRGFMGKEWDGGDIAFQPETWRLVFDLLKPGGHLFAFGGTRTYHRMVCAIEDAGFEIRDQFAWVYGSGMPKSFNIDRERGKSICECAGSALPYIHEGAQPEAQCDLHSLRNSYVSPSVDTGEGRRQVLQPGLSEQSASDAGRSELPPAEIRAGQSSLEGWRDDLQEEGRLRQHQICESAGMGQTNGAQGWISDGAPLSDGPVVRLPADPERMCPSFGPQSAQQSDHQPRIVAGQSEPQVGGAWPICGGCGLPMVPKGLGTAVKPAWEPIVLARKPLIGTVAENVLEHGTGALNIDGCRVDAEGHRPWRQPSGCGVALSGSVDGSLRNPIEDRSHLGRFPANLVHDGSEEVLGAFARSAGNENVSRYFYCAKASKTGRAGSKHPTVKPVSLIRWLVRLITPPGGTVLDPFAGSGTTGEAALLEGKRAILIEREAEYVEDIARRLRRTPASRAAADKQVAPSSQPVQELLL